MPTPDIRFRSLVADIAARVDGPAPDKRPRFSRTAVERWCDLTSTLAVDWQYVDLAASFGLDLGGAEGGDDWAPWLALLDLGIRVTRIVREPSYKAQRDKAARDAALGRPTIHQAPLWRDPLSAGKGQPEERGIPALILPVGSMSEGLEARGGVEPLSLHRLGDDGFLGNISDLIALPLDGGRPLSMTGFSLVIGEFEPEPNGRLTLWGSGKAWLDAHLLAARASAADTPGHMVEQLHMPFAPPPGVLLTEPRALQWRITAYDCALPRSVTEILCPDSVGLARLIDAEMRKKEPPRPIPTVRAPAHPKEKVAA